MQGQKTNNFDAIAVRIASPEEIKQWTKETACHCANRPNCGCGEVKKPETINYRTFRPERDGLFCEAIFGPTKDWECACGKYKRIKHKGVVCDRCGVEVTQAKVRRERMGYIQLAAPVSHIWFFKGMPSRIGTLLDISYRELERVIYFEAYVVLDPGDSPHEPRTLLTEEEYHRDRQRYDFRAEMGAAAVRELLESIDLKREAEVLRQDLAATGSKLKAKKFRKRLKLILGVMNSGNKPEWMILDVIPVIPPELRPLVPLDGGRFATSDLNDLYRRVINRNNRLKRLIDLRAPDVIIRNEKRMLQEAVDALLDNGRHGRQVRGPGSRPLKSLSDMLKGKPGRFRQNLLGKRVDYSGRSVIVIGPELQLHQCGLPKKMALELFKPFIIRKLQEKGYAQTIKSAKKMAERVTPDVWEVVEEVIAEHPVLLNRAPTLHRLGIQAFQPILVEGKAIRIHPLVCQAFNADFDGDQMAVHVPLSTEAQIECKLLMSATRNLLKPAHGGPIAVPDLDVVLGCNYLTKEVAVEGQDIPEFSDMNDALYAYTCGHLGVHNPIKLLVEGTLIHTTIGRVVFNQIVPDEIPFKDSETGATLHFCNQEFHSRQLEQIVAMSYERCGSRQTVHFLDQLKELGFHYATISGISIAIGDMLIPELKQGLIAEAQQEVDDVEEAYQEGEITQSERYNKIIGIWGGLTDDVQEALFDVLKEHQRGLNPVHIMADSGARSKKEPIRQIAGMRGLMTKPSGEIIETPIFANFREGLSVLEYFISTHGARKGLADTAIKTASSGYLTRKLVDVAQDVIITEVNCGTVDGIEKVVPEDEEGEPLSDKLFGRVVLDDIVNRHGEILASAGDLITRECADRIEAAGTRRVRVRSVLTCETPQGVCRKCYGSDLSTGRPVDIGESVGIIAAQSIGEPGTQLTMRTFHTGGAISGSEEATVYARYAGKIEYHDITSVKTNENDYAVLSRSGYLVVNDEGGMEVDRRKVPYGSKLLIEDGATVGGDQALLRLELHHIPILTEAAGRVEYIDIIDNVTVHQEIDETTGLQSTVVIEYRGEDYQARIQIVRPGQEPVVYRMPTKAHIAVRDGDDVAAGDVLARIPLEASKARDIVMGLPRVTELFEARKPKEHAIISDIDGIVRFREIRRGMQILQVVNEETGIEGESYRIPLGKHIIIQDGDMVRAGDPLTDGPINPHDYVRVKGEAEAQAYLIDEVQRVYRAQGEPINDKHIEVIIRQMMRKVSVDDPGDTEFLEGDELMRTTFRRENERVLRRDGKPATGQPILQGITKAALSTDSFISAASFQQTTNVLTRAAVNGLRDSLRGLKENVIMGRLIPAGTGVPLFRQLEATPQEEPLEESQPASLEE